MVLNYYYYHGICSCFLFIVDWFPISWIEINSMNACLRLQSEHVWQTEDEQWNLRGEIAGCGVMQPERLRTTSWAEASRSMGRCGRAHSHYVHSEEAGTGGKQQCEGTPCITRKTSLAFWISRWGKGSGGHVHETIRGASFAEPGE